MADLDHFREALCQEIVRGELDPKRLAGWRIDALRRAQVACGRAVTKVDKSAGERVSRLLREDRVQRRIEHLRNRVATMELDEQARVERIAKPPKPKPGVPVPLPPAADDVAEPASETLKLRAFDTSVRATLRELACIGMADPREIVDESGNLRDLKDMPEHLARAVSSIKVHRQRSPEGSQTKAETVEVKFWPKVEALRLIGQHRRMFVELKEIGPAGEFANLSDAELDAEIAKYEALDAIERAQGRKAKAGGGGR